MLASEKVGGVHVVARCYQVVGLHPSWCSVTKWFRWFFFIAKINGEMLCGDALLPSDALPPMNDRQ